MSLEIVDFAPGDNGTLFSVAGETAAALERRLNEFRDNVIASVGVGARFLGQMEIAAAGSGGLVVAHCSLVDVQSILTPEFSLIEFAVVETNAYADVVPPPDELVVRNSLAGALQTRLIEILPLGGVLFVASLAGMSERRFMYAGAATPPFGG